MNINTNMNMYTMTLVKNNALGDGYIIEPKYMPKKWEPKQFIAQLNLQSNASAAEANSIIETHKKELLDKLHAGQGDLSMEEWDDFLLQLTDMGLITNGQRMEAMGLLIPLPDLPNGITPSSTECIHWVSNEEKSDPYDAYLMNHWNGNPLDFLQDMDFYLHKQMLSANLNHLGTTSIEKTRKTYDKIAEIIKGILI